MKRYKGYVPSSLMKNKTVKYILIALAIVFIIFSVINNINDFKNAKDEIKKADGYLSAHYIDVGQGDATLLRSPDGKFMLIDCGPPSGSDELVKYLNKCGVESLEYLLITHPHDDHYGGAFDVIENFDVENFIIHKDSASDNAFKKLSDNLGRKKSGVKTNVIKTKIGDSFEFAGCVEFQIIAPEKVDKDDPNNSSLCVKLTYGDTSFLFTGDAEKEIENQLLKSKYDLASDVFQAGHHGSSTSNTKKFVEAVNPKYAVISCAKDNRYGHPHKETVALFNDNGIEMLRTDKLGSIVILSDGDVVSYTENFFETGSSKKNAA